MHACRYLDKPLRLNNGEQYSNADREAERERAVEEYKKEYGKGKGK